MDPVLAAMRRDYTRHGLNEADLLADPISQFKQWFDDSKRAEIYEPNAMALATADACGQPSVRIVLLKIVDPDGLVFFTNLESRKGRELKANPKAALTFWWGPLERQVRFEGEVETVPDEISDHYFKSRPPGSRIGAWASRQSSVIDGRSVLEAEAARQEERFRDREVERPEFWGGYRLRPSLVEFWQGRQDRLHDRLAFIADGRGGWRVDRLSP